MTGLFGPNTVVDKSEEIPFGSGFGLEVPEDPAGGLIAVNINLRLDVVGGGLLELGRPLVDEVDIGARTDVLGGLVGAVVVLTREGSVVAGTDTVAVLCGG